MGFFCYVVMVI